MSTQRATISDIAKKLSLSKSTVSKALSNATDISEQTRERVLSCASELGYHVEPSKSPKEKSIVVFIYGITYGDADQFGYEILLGIQSAASQSNYGVKVVAINDDELKSGKYYSVMSGGNYEGSCFLGFCPHETFIQHVQDANLPIVVLENYFDSPLVTRISCDNSHGIRQVVTHLLEKGHRRIAYLGGEKDSIVTQEREKAYCDTLLSFGIQPSKKLIQYAHFSGKGVKRPALALVAEKPTAIVCVSDIVACSAVRILTSEGYSVPEDISVTGYDDLPAARYCHPPLTTVLQNRIHIGKAAFSMLLLMKSGIKIDSMFLRPELVIRDSVREIVPAEPLPIPAPADK